MEVPAGGPPKPLTITHQIPEMDPHVFSYGAGCMSMMVMYLSTKAKEHMDSYTDGCPSGMYTYSWGQITLCIAAVLVDRSLPDELVAPLQGLASSSLSVSSSVMANAGWCAMLTRCSTLLRMFCSMPDSAKALMAVVPPAEKEPVQCVPPNYGTSFP